MAACETALSTQQVKRHSGRQRVELVSARRDRPPDENATAHRTPGLFITDRFLITVGAGDPAALSSHVDSKQSVGLSPAVSDIHTTFRADSSWYLVMSTFPRRSP